MNSSSTSTAMAGRSCLPRTGLAARLLARPVGMPGPDDIGIVEVEVPGPGPGQVVVRNLFMSLDPGMLTLMAGGTGLPMPGYEVGGLLYGDAVGEVVASAGPELREGDLVVHRLGWREYATGPAGEFRRVDRDAYPTPPCTWASDSSPTWDWWKRRGCGPGTPSSCPARREPWAAWRDRSRG
ncbi:hypothetical protein AB6O49_13545 [Streptomyces sp. SBR177]